MGEEESGLFSTHGLALTIADPAPREQNIKRVADEGADVCLTSVQHYLTARARYGDLAARFVAVIGQSSSLSIIVPDASDMSELKDIAGRRLAGSKDNPHVSEVLAVMAQRQLGTPTLVDLPSPDAYPALARGEIDGVVGFADGLPRVRRDAGIDVKALSLNLDVYASGLVARDSLSDEIVGHVRDALADALVYQQKQPSTGLAQLKRDFPSVDPSIALQGWSMAEPHILIDGVEPGHMSRARWLSTLRFACDARQLPLDPTTVYRANWADRVEH